MGLTTMRPAGASGSSGRRERQQKKKQILVSNQHVIGIVPAHLEHVGSKGKETYRSRPSSRGSSPASQQDMNLSQAETDGSELGDGKSSMTVSISC